jgi:hypothetical protein
MLKRGHWQGDVWDFFGPVEIATDSAGPGYPPEEQMVRVTLPTSWNTPEHEDLKIRLWYRKTNFDPRNE